jgi:site-specific recombinase XerD
MSHNISPIEKFKQQFLEYIEIERGRSPLTVRNYDHYISRFIGYAKIKKPEDISSELVRTYRLWLNRQPRLHYKSTTETLKKKTQNYYLIALRAFLKYLARNNVKTLSAEHIDLAKVGERQIDLITAEELKRLLAAPDGESDIKSLRDKAILEMLFSTGSHA